MDPEARKVVELGYGGSERLTMNMGPQHPSAHGVFRAILSLEGETVVGVDAVIGYLHRCHEKLGETLTYTQYPSIASKTDYVAAMCSELAYVRAAEAVGKIEVPKRAQYLRVIVSELQRVASHCLWLGTWCLDMGGALGGGATVFLYCIREREWVLDLFEALVGARLLYGFHQVGGVRYDIPAGWAQKCRETVSLIERRLVEYEDMLERNAFFQARTQGVGLLTASDAIALGVSGPSLRGSGVDYDVRKYFPYSSYEEFEFQVPVRTEGDCYARYLCRVAEMRESLKIVRQAMGKIPPEGSIRADAPGIVAPQREKMKIEMEALIYHFKIYTEGFAPPPGEVYQRIESPRGELGCFIASDGSPKPYRMRIRAPSFVNLQALKKMVEGRLIADVIASIGTLDIVLGEIDR